MNKIIVIGPSGAGKSEMSRKLHDILDLPLYHLDNIFWKQDIFDPEFKQWIIDWFENTRPRVLSLLEKYKSVKRIVILSSRKEGDEFINSLQQLLT